MCENRLQTCIDYLISVDRVKSPAHFAELIGKQKSFVSEILSGKRKLSESFVHSVTNQFPEISDRWLLSGEGSIDDLHRIYDRINKILALEGITKRDFAKGTSDLNFIFPRVYRNAENNPADIKVAAGWIECILRLFPYYSEEWIKTGKGSLYEDPNYDPEKDKHRKLASGTPLIPIDAFPVFASPAFNDDQILDFYYVDEFKHADFLIREKGNSMCPTFGSGDIVACKIVKETLFFQWNKIYAIYTGSQGVMVKRVKQSARDGCILLVSDNPAYDPFDVPLSDIAALALVIGVIRVE